MDDEYRHTGNIMIGLMIGLFGFSCIIFDTTSANEFTSIIFGLIIGFIFGKIRHALGYGG